MNLRTIVYWVVYDPSKKVIVTTHQFKKDVRRVFAGCVLVQMKGHYFPPRVGRTHWKGRP